jgi:hypothetical protein
MSGEGILAAGPAPSADEVEIVTFPVMRTFHAGVLVQRVEDSVIPAQPSAHGGISLGSAHLPEVGGVMHLALHLPSGETLLATLGFDGVRHLAILSNAAITELESGKYNKPEVAQ